MDKVLIIKCLGIIFFLFISFTYAQALSPNQIFDKVKNSIVIVKTLNYQNKITSQGSGVILPSGKIATNCHVVDGGAAYLVGRGTNLVGATLYAEDKRKDICILDVEHNIGKPVQLGKACNLKVGVPVYAVGAPKGLELSISDGIVSQLRGGKPPLIQTTASISPGSSGGGLFNQEGQLVGLTTLYIEGGQSLNFAMPAEWINDVKPAHKAATGNERKFYKQGHLNESNVYLDKEININPKDEHDYRERGFAYSQLGKYNEAIADYDKALHMNPNNGLTHAQRAAVYSKLEKYDEAIADLNKAIELRPNVSLYYGQRGWTYSQLGKYNKSIVDFDKAIELDPTYAKFYYSRAGVYSMTVNINNAIRDLDKAIQMKPNFRNLAKTDKNFDNMRNNSDFKRLIGE